MGREEVDWGKEQRSHLAMNLAWPSVFYPDGGEAEGVL